MPEHVGKNQFHPVAQKECDNSKKNRNNNQFDDHPNNKMEEFHRMLTLNKIKKKTTNHKKSRSRRNHDNRENVNI